MNVICRRMGDLSRAMLACLALCLAAQLSHAESPALSESAEATHAQLRALRDALLGAWQQRDLDGMLSHVAPNVVVTWQNGEVSRGPEGLRKFYDEVLSGNDKIVTHIASTLKVDELSILYGEGTAIAFGSIHDELTLNHSIARAAFLGAGDVFKLDSRWTATLVKIDGQWKLAAYHVSTDAFSNPILAKAVAAGQREAILAGVGGLIVGALAVWFFRRRRSVR